MFDALYRGARFRLFNVIDDYNRESIAIEIDPLIRSASLVSLFKRLKGTRGLTAILRVDDGPEW